MKRFLSVLLCTAAAVSVALSCTETDDFLDEEEGGAAVPEVKHALEIAGISLENKGATMVVDVNLSEDIDTLLVGELQDLSVSGTELHVLENRPFFKYVQPQFKEAHKVASEYVKANDLHIEVIVDLTVAKREVEEERNAVKLISSVFPPEYFNLVFMDENGISSPLPASEYVINNYFKRSSGEGKLLYRGLRDRILENIPADSLSASDTAGKKILVLFSDGKVYKSNYNTIDSKHFALQEELYELGGRIAASGGTLYYINFAAPGTLNEAENFIKSICELSGGICQDTFSWTEMQTHLFDQFGIEHTDFRFIFKNPKGKVYNGRGRRLFLEIRTAGRELLADGETTYTEGTFYRPMVVGGRSQIWVIEYGTLIFLFLMVIVYLVCQLLVPKIGNSIFERKYVRRFTNANMNVGGVLVGSECYYCKAPFVPGEKIVAKCKHVMHKECWDENGYHCPEYGRNCKDGSHYYNPAKPFDIANAGYYMKWVLGALVAGFASWVLFSLVSTVVMVDLLKNLVFMLLRVKAGTPEADEIVMNHINNISLFPSFGLYIGFLLTLVLSCMTVHRRGKVLTALEIAGRSIAGGIAGYAVFYLGCVATIIIDTEISYVVNWIAWALTGYAIALISTVWTKIRVRKKWAVVAIVLGGVSMLIWNILFTEIGMDYRIPLMVSHLVFAVGIALSVAHSSPRSERYYFHLSGAMKDMDIAIYKWFEANTNRVVTIGRSVDCDLVMSWDMAGDIAPVQANVTKDSRYVYITPIEEGVFVGGRPLPVGKTKRLYHGRHFTIGKTEFVYLEKDV